MSFSLSAALRQGYRVVCFRGDDVMITAKSTDKREESLRVFSQTATIYDRIGPPIFSYFGQRLVDLADPIRAIKCST